MKSSRAKQRGQRRKWNKLLAYVNEISYRAYLRTEQAFEHFHVPGDGFLDSLKTSGKIKTAFCREWIRETERLIAGKPRDIGFCKVVCVLCRQELYSSQIIIFYDEEYFNGFWNRAHNGQQWVRCTDDRSLTAQRNIQTNLPELHILETLRDGDETFNFDLWFYGEWPER
ncbi:MAG: DUF3916 domain-containing protein [Clostridia bacterium]|nr:DUF3916 domain-containing protein [Clostridia bacterium]